MAIYSIDQYLVDADKINIPDEGLGAFIGGLQDKPQFIWRLLWFNLAIGIGQVFFLLYLLLHWWMKTHPKRVLLYQNGFIKQYVDSRGKVMRQKVVNFSEVKGIRYAKTRNYKSSIFDTTYTGTSVVLSILYLNNSKKKILKGLYHNEEEVDGHYNFIGYACNAINNAWTKYAINRFNQELSLKGYGSFYTRSGDILVGRNFIDVNGTEIKPGFTYSFEDGRLYLYPNSYDVAFKKKYKPIVVNVIDMYNQEAFLIAVGQLHGIQ